MYDCYINQMITLLELKGCSPRTIEVYCYYLTKLLTTLDKPVDDITTEDLMQYLHQMVSSGISNGTVNQNHSIFRLFFSKILGKEHIVTPIPYMKRGKKLPEVLTSKEILAVLAASKNLKYKAIFMTLYSSGLRAGEVLRLKVSDIDSSKMQLRITQSKRKKDRYTILSKYNLSCLRDYYRDYRPEELLFYSYSYKQRPLSINTIEKEFKSAVKAAGITKKVHPHSLRHSFACHLLENGTDIYTIKTLLGHSTIQSTEVYLQLSPSYVLSAKSPMDQVLADE